MNSDVPLPKDPRHQRYADLRLRGESIIDSYIGAGFKAVKGRSGTSSAGKRIEKRADVRAYMDAIRSAAAKSTVLDLAEKREFLARVVRVPLSAIDPDNQEDPNYCIVRKIKRRRFVEDEQEGEVIEFEKLDPLKAIDLDNKLSGDDPEANAMAALAEELCRLGGGTSAALPTGKL